MSKVTNAQMSSRQQHKCQVTYIAKSTSDIAPKNSIAHPTPNDSQASRTMIAL